jgi:ABC-type phosphate transport system substrate-binding protein
MLQSRKSKVAIAAAGAVAMTLGLVAQASADVQPRNTDAVGVGSDTVQYVVDFLADGSGINPGYNTGNTSRRVFSFDATADANGRAAYQNSSTNALASTIVLRAGSNPVARPNGSGAGIGAFLADSGHKIDFVRSSRLPTAAEQTTAAGAPSFGGLGIHVYQIATDGLQIAVNNTGTGTLTNAPASVSCVNLVNIYNGTYKKWSDVPGYSGPAPADGIVPVIPQSGSGTAKDFIKDLTACNGGTTFALGGNVVTSEEHDPTGITGIAAHTDINGNPVSKLDGIAPFSTGRNNLINSGYFGASPAPNTVALLGGTSYILNRSLYILCRDADVASTTPFQLGGALNLAKTLFALPTSYFNKAAQAPLYTAAGVVQSFVDAGVTSAG